MQSIKKSGAEKHLKSKNRKYLKRDEAMPVLSEAADFILEPSTQ